MLLASTALTVPCAYADGPLPSGATVSAGNASIETAGSALTVRQDTDRAIVDWNSFSIDRGFSVDFIQPDASSAILNRVTGNTTSVIAGTLSANGQVYLVNPNGIAITADGVINVGSGFVGSTLDITNEDFLNGRLTFRGTGASAGISNAGVVQVGREGYAALIGGSVRNDGLVAVPLGRIGLAAGEQATLDFSGDGFLQVAVATEAPSGDALIDQRGTLRAAGGMIVMSAAMAREAARHTINLSGVVEANAVDGHDGAIIIRGGEGGAVTVAGKLTATSAFGEGGAIEVTGRDILLSGATLDASGAAGGGSVRIGGDWQGTGTLQRAETTQIDAGSTIRADATTDGDGSDVVVWSDSLTTFEGLISARGAGAGNGGDAEVSGKAKLAYAGYTDLSAENGTFGTLLLDPYNLTISDQASSNIAGFTASGEDSILNATTLTDALAGANVTVSTSGAGSQAGDILVASKIAWDANTTLTLDAANDIGIFADIIATGDSAGLALNYGAGRDYIFAQGATATLSGTNATLAIDGQAYTLLHSVAEINAIDTTGLDDHYALAEPVGPSSYWSILYPGALVGSSSTPFTGVFAGLGHEISWLRISAFGSGNLGLFASNEGVIRDLGFRNGRVEGGNNVGLVAGVNSGTIKNVWATGLVFNQVSGDNNTGGLVGYNTAAGVIESAYTDGTISGDDSVGGVVGFNAGSVSNTYATGKVTGRNYVGGLIGNLSAGTVDDTHGDADVSGAAYVGGLVGMASTGVVVNDAYVTGSVTGSGAYVGGVIGYNQGTFNRVYASGKVVGGSVTGGVIGQNTSGVVSSSFYDQDTTGQTLGIGLNSAGSVTSVGLTTAEARDASSYTTFDFSSTWFQDADLTYPRSDMRPILRSEAGPTINGVTAVSNLHQLALIGVDLSGSYLMTRDIDAGATDGADAAGIWNTTGWVPLGKHNPTEFQFSGSFNGGGHVISDLNINQPGANARDIGMFGFVSGEISNIGMEGGAIVGNSSVGALAGRLGGTGSISNAYATSSVTAGTYTGGLIGYVHSGASVSNSHAGGTVTASATVGSLDSTGGLVGYNDGGILQDVYATGDVLGGNYSGGLVGRNVGNGTVTNAYATGAVSGNSWVGGLMGRNDVGEITRSYATGDVTAVNLNSYAGGLVGQNLSRGKIHESYATGAVSGDNYVGGLVGNMTGSIANAYATGDVAGSDNVGGLAGWIETGSITNAYATGAVTATGSSVGGLVGYNNGGGATLTASYFDTETTGQSEGVGTGLSDGVIGLTTAQFQNTGYFYALADAAGWDFETAWAPPSAGYYPELYALSPVVWLGGVSANSTYGDSTAAIDAVTASYGGPASYIFGSSGDDLSINIGSLGAISVDPTLDAGGQTVAFLTPVVTTTSREGVSYRVVGYGNADLTIDPRAITVRADNFARIYGDANPVLTYALTSGNLVNGDTLNGALATSADGTSGVGTYAITRGSLANSNYAITFVDGDLTIDPRAITVRADNFARIYGDANPVLTYALTSGNLVNGDTLAGALATSADGTSGVGTYAITQGALANSNYAITFVDGQLTIDPRAITVTADNLFRFIAGPNPGLTYAITTGNLVNRDTLDGTLATDANVASEAGTYDITQGSLSASSNYEMTYVGGTLTVRKPERMDNGLNGTLDQNTLLPNGTTQLPPVVRTSRSADSGSGLQTYEDPQLENAVCMEDTPFAVVCSKSADKDN
ncbi:MBG domain-containing protein [Hyphomonas adhaerens]|nr:MBG domain-containing protein [Hyphomonas adhaerens]